MRRRRAQDREPTATLATRIPRELQRGIRVHCLLENRLMRDFVLEAIEEHLRRVERR